MGYLRQKFSIPMSNRLLENPITVGVGHVLNCTTHLQAKASARGQGGYDLDQQPLKEKGCSAGERLSGLEIHSLLSAGDKTLKEGSTLRGTKNDEYWRAIRQGYKPKTSRHSILHGTSFKLF